MSVVAVKWAVNQRAGSASAKAVLFVLAEAANSRTGACYPSQATIAERAELAPRSVWEAMRELERGGLIRRSARRDRRGHRTTDLITLNMGGQLASPATRDDEPQLALDATRDDEPQLATDAVPTRSSCESLLAPGAKEPGRRGTRKRTGKRERRASPLPEICPTEAQISDAQDHFNEAGAAIDAGLEAQKFRSYHIAHGTTSKSWPHSWATWVLRAPEFQRSPGQQPRHSAMGWLLDGDPQ